MWSPRLVRYAAVTGWSSLDDRDYPAVTSIGATWFRNGPWGMTILREGRIR